jgi:uncharacterized RDD family membrane protein YckC/type II secretory pathway pseudopilin PulG
MENQDWINDHSETNSSSSIPKAGTVPVAPKLTFTDPPVSPPPVQAAPPISVPPETTVAPVAADEIKYAGFWVRYVANVIDGIVLVVPIIIIDLALLFLTGLKGGNSGLTILSYILNCLIIWSYFMVMTYKYQATLGKMAVGVKVVSDKSDRLTVGQLILRETLGKILSLIILYIGYIMAGFTKRKQALHDKIAKTVVVYKDPNSKVAWWAVALALVLPAIAVIGILSSIVLVSLSSARNKAEDASSKSLIAAQMPAALIFYDSHSSFKGFTPDLGAVTLQACAGNPIINIAPDGNSLAVFMKSCANPSKYFCDDVTSDPSYNGQLIEVDAQYAQSGASSCVNNPSSQVNQRPASSQTAENIQGQPAQTPSPSSVNSNISKSNLNNHDIAISLAFTLVADDITPYQEMNKTYAGFKEDLSKYDIDTPDCHSIMKLDIKPDGTAFVLHQPLCSDPAKSFCLENMGNQVKIVDTLTVDKTFHCQ